MLLTIRLPVDAFSIGPRGETVAQPPGAGIIEGIADGLSFVELQQATWESQVSTIAANIEERLGLEVERFTRLPYINQSDRAQFEFYALDTAVLVLRRKGEAEGECE